VGWWWGFRHGIVPSRWYWFFPTRVRETASTVLEIGTRKLQVREFLLYGSWIESWSRSNTGLAASSKSPVNPNPSSSSSSSSKNSYPQENNTHGSYFMCTFHCVLNCTNIERRRFTWREYVMLTTSIVGLCTTCYYRFDSEKIFEDIEGLLDKFFFQFK